MADVFSLAIVVLLCALSTLAAEDACALKCSALKNRSGDDATSSTTTTGHYGFGCGGECDVEQCIIGCKLSNAAIEANCNTLCNVTAETSQRDFCLASYNDTYNILYQTLKDRIGTPPAPVLVADSLTSSSLSLEWEGAHHNNAIYLVQLKYEDLPGGWQYYRHHTWRHSSIVGVDRLQPYTKYRFRVAVLLPECYNDPIISAPSVVISTLSRGAPSSGPVNLRVTTMDSHRVSLSWEPGHFPNGPILSYILKIAETAVNGYVALKDLPATGKNQFYTFQGLSPLMTYKVEVAMRNGEGEGPSASVTVTTPALSIAVNNQQPIFLLTGEHSILQRSADMQTNAFMKYNTSKTIQGVGVHIGKDLLFISDSSDSVHRISLNAITDVTTILTPASMSYRPLDISVDWLNDHLYILGEVNHSDDDDWQRHNSKRWQIVRCDFDGKYQTVAIAGFHTMPAHTEVDPYNGYLFWVTRDGLYRLDLAHISNGIKHEVAPDQILNERNLGAFTVDHTNFRIFIPHLKNNTMLSVSLDGREVTNYRANTKRPMFESIKSLSYANGLFYWTTGKDIVIEEHYKSQNTFYQNKYPVQNNGTINTMLVYLRVCQPIPVAVNPPIGLQSVMGFNHAKITWQPPHLLGHQGNGAWQQWEYDLQITNLQNNLSSSHRTNKTSFTVKDLIENTTYAIKAAAVTLSGVGPWSSEFTAKTLIALENGSYSFMLWSAQEGLLKSDLTGDNVQTLIHLDSSFITDVSWYKDLLYMVTNMSTVIMYNITSKERHQMNNMENVGSLAVDWIGKRLYWSKPMQQVINRGGLRGENKEQIPLPTVGKELKIDSLKGFLYWNTGHAIECARLNGENKVTYYTIQLFKKQVIGLTIDFHGRTIYWIIHGYEGSKLYKAPTADLITPGSEIMGTMVSSLSNGPTLGPLCYFSDRLIWLQDQSRAVISDIKGNNKANLNSSAKAQVNMIAVIDSDQQNFNGKVNVIPQKINISTVKVVGEWNVFNITWDHVTNVNHGEVFYEVIVKCNGKTILARKTLHNYVEYSDGEVSPFASISVSIKSYTYWGSAAEAVILTKSPQALPTNPLKPRVFILHQYDPIWNENEIRAIFRWNPPLHANGEIKNYKVKCWYAQDEISHTACEDVIVDRLQYEYVAKNLLKNVTYHFQVTACNEAGFGPSSHNVSALTGIESVIPQLAVAYHDSIQVIDLDPGYSSKYTISLGAGKPVDIAANLREESVYWMNDNKELFLSKLYKTGHTKIATINGTGVSIAVDWVNRLLYWSQIENPRDISVVYQLDLNVFDMNRENDEIPERRKRILERNTRIHSLNLSPLTKHLFWVEIDRHNLGKLFKSNIDGSNIRTVFHKDTVHNPKNNCNCSEDPAIGKSINVDTSNNKIYWTDWWFKHIMVSDFDGCQCTVLVNGTIHNNRVSSPQLIAVDNKYIYWSDVTHNKIHYTDKTTTGTIYKTDISTGHRMLAIEKKTQPYPPAICLLPKQIPLRVSPLNRTSTSLTVRLPEAIRHEGCGDIDMATPRYTLYYRRYSGDHEANCTGGGDYKTVESYDRVVRVDDLKPFTKYAFRLKVNNYYGKLNGVIAECGSSVIWQTYDTAPKAVTNIKAAVVSPNQAIVEWSVPVENRGNSLFDNEISYEIHCRTEGTPSNNRGEEHTTYLITKAKPLHGLNRTQENLLKLLPGQRYSIWVKSRSLNSNMSSDSETVSISTYPEPYRINATFIGPYMMHVSWKPYEQSFLLKYTIEYTSVETNVWKSVQDEGSLKLDGSVNYVIQNLTPSTQYKFRIKLYFVNGASPYIWPTDSAFIFETLADRPSPPGKPVVQKLSTSIYQLQWLPSDAHGSAILLYRLFGEIQPANDNATLEYDAPTASRYTYSSESETALLLSRQTREPNQTLAGVSFFEFAPTRNEDRRCRFFKGDDNAPRADWIMLYNGTDNYWIVADLKLSERYIFHVQSLNRCGWSAFSLQSEEFDFADTVEEFKYYDILIAIVVPMILFVIIFFIIWNRTVLNYKNKANQPLPMMHGGPLRGPDVELATLRELPRFRGGVGMFQHSTNILYNNGQCHTPTDADLAQLPHIRRDQISLTKFLGSGAFGEVFEGKAKDLEHEGSVTRVAIKTLRKGATDQEKNEFLQEAQLMSNFKYEHILSMLGVCLDNNPHFIIMELMEGGDLLSYLRARRPMLYTNDSLTLQDLLLMCRDVTKGCKYLEDMHFVHRDLACRNCLVSQQADGRVVKIGDFGLARDIYKNDYYRKEGEGLMPVRWMAVECLTDGVFSRASDVWAWAVLCWEVATLGQQPYSALPNHAVMRYVRGGGTLQRPANCPAELYTLLKKCWSYHPDNRPTFNYCLEALEELMLTVQVDVPLVAPIDEEPQYITVIPDGQSSFLDYPTTASTTNGLFSDMPRYLQVVGDSAVPVVSHHLDGYEVPRSSMRYDVPRPQPDLAPNAIATNSAIVYPDVISRSLESDLERSNVRTEKVEVCADVPNEKLKSLNKDEVKNFFVQQPECVSIV